MFIDWSNIEETNQTENFLNPFNNPKALYDKNFLACNKGRVYYTDAPNKTYSTQFAKDVDNFLNARAKELVSGGLMAMILSGIPEGTPYSYIPTSMI